MVLFQVRDVAASAPVSTAGAQRREMAELYLMGGSSGASVSFRLTSHHSGERVANYLVSDDFIVWITAAWHCTSVPSGKGCIQP